jgi:hypothetical protein
MLLEGLDDYGVGHPSSATSIQPLTMHRWVQKMKECFSNDAIIGAAQDLIQRDGTVHRMGACISANPKRWHFQCAGPTSSTSGYGQQHHNKGLVMRSHWKLEVPQLLHLECQTEMRRDGATRVGILTVLFWPGRCQIARGPQCGVYRPAPMMIYSRS